MTMEILSALRQKRDLNLFGFNLEDLRVYYYWNRISDIAIPYKSFNGTIGATLLPTQCKLYRFIKSELSDAEWYFSYFSHDLIVASELFKLISGPESSEMLQDTLFDFLGIEKLDLICELLAKRENVIKDVYELFLRRKSYLEFSKQPKSHPTQSFHFSNNLIKNEKNKLKRFNKKNFEHFNKKYGHFNWNFIDQFFAEVKPSSENFENLPVSSKFPHGTRKYRNVYDSDLTKVSPFAVGNKKLYLPSSTVRSNFSTYEEFIIKPSTDRSIEFLSSVLEISKLSTIEKRVFDGIKSLNVIQSLIYETALNSFENLLICAPTGAGKTNIALLTIIRELKLIEHGDLTRDELRIVYIAPMKALASEITQKFTKTLRFLNLNIREVTGDTQLPKKEISSCHLIVTTPEKWDILTRRSDSETSFTLRTRLLIIDEIHLLQDDRGAVLESLVARAHRMTQTRQLSLRIIGLSATLPNYLDVATFLNVNPDNGLFYFDSNFRTVPLEQRFVGVKPSTSPYNTSAATDEICFDKTLEFMKESHQVIIFVHSRDSTRKTAQKLREYLCNQPLPSSFVSKTQSFKHQKRFQFQNRLLEDLADSKISIHHAGLSKHDRSIVERLFSQGVIQVLVSTSTLAWGVNLPARAVIIKGTSFYDTNKGGFRDIGILDVQQMFGRAGRPQFDTQGCGILITDHGLLSSYIGSLINNFPIESRFLVNLPDALNAEIVLGTVSNVAEAIDWLSYTFMHVRMIKNPLVYGLTQKELDSDINLTKYRRGLVLQTAKVLEKSKMVRFNPSTEYFDSTSLGRIGSHYYIKHKSIDLFMSNLKESMTDSEILFLVSMSSEFEQIKIRDDEVTELGLLNSRCPYQSDKVLDSTRKVVVLLQAYICKMQLESSSLASDMMYISQNIGRLMRGYYEICVYQGYPYLIHKFLNLIKSFEQRTWYYEHPLTQIAANFNINPACIGKLAGLKMHMDQLEEMTAYEIGSLLHHVSLGSTIRKMIDYFPRFDMEIVAQPITRTVLQLTITFVPKFQWNNSIMCFGSDEWALWIEDPDTHFITHYDQIKLGQKKLKNETITEVFAIPLFEPLPAQFIVRLVSFKFLGAESEAFINPCDLHLPEMGGAFTDLLPLQPLPISALNNPQFNKLYRFKYFNPIQTQVYHSLYLTDKNILLGAPTGSGKTIVAELAMLRAFKDTKAKVVYISPLKALIKERMVDWNERFGQTLHKNVVELTGDVNPDTVSIMNSDIILTTPEKWDGISRKWRERLYTQAVKLLIIDEVHLLGADRGHILEAIVSRVKIMNHETGKNIRIVALSTAVSNSLDLARWINVPSDGLFNFGPSVRPVPLEVHICGFSAIHYCPRMESMNKTVYLSIKNYSPSQPVLIFTSSRRQTRRTAEALLALSTVSDVPDKWCNIDSSELCQITSRCVDSSLKSFIEFGVGIHHAGLVESDRRITEELFLNNKIRILVATSTLAWGVNFPAHLVIIKGTEYYDCKTHTYIDFPITEILQMMGRAGRPQFDDSGIAVILVQKKKKNFYKRFLYNPFPVESFLIPFIPDHLNAEIASGTIISIADVLNYLKLSYLNLRLANNPSYYNLRSSEPTCIDDFLADIATTSLHTLNKAGCVFYEPLELKPTKLGIIASNYYLSHQTIQLFNCYINRECSMRDLLCLLSRATEFDKVPVRHNEDTYNEDLSKVLPISGDSSDFSLPSTKVFLLLQAHVGRFELPIKDYHTDTKSIIDQAIRILQSMKDICVYKSFLKTALQCTILLQCILQRGWWHKSSLLCIPGVECTNYSRFCDIVSKIMSMDVDSVAQLTELDSNSLKNLNTELFQWFEEWRAKDIYRYLELIPKITVSWSLLDEKNVLATSEKLGSRKKSARNLRFIKVRANTKMKLVINLERDSLEGIKTNKVYNPYIGRDVDESWMLFLGEKENDKLIELKRIPPIRCKSKTLMFIGPWTDLEVGSRIILTMYLMSESLFGLDQQYEIPLEIVTNSQKLET
ncbi:Activating signal cointegrator 1 complex subunit 3 [Thelohanellus kitauei]|uniref:U5 small nuclear ribonucleoprotein 200 kDa helicase n=1 Tax=Thelohanellus kitauei TaxID=669202 RepID=A0A0C2NE85_THEKT|nr:Activating signal cointegrator 1 complex subunit 3 [Thelohanellus kitauei]